MNDDTTRRYSLFPKTLASCVEPVTRPLFKEQASATTRLITQWESIAGPELARHTKVEKLSFPKGKQNGGTLTVSVENGFALEIQHMQQVIMDRLAEYFGYRAIERIAISHTFLPPAETPTSSSKKMKPSLPSGSGKIAEGVEDNELKAALQSLAKTLSGQHT
jgi:hypothetical protein